MIGRVTHTTIQRSSLANLQTNLGRMAELQAKMSSGKNVQIPSDDPAATSDVLALNRESARLTQYDRNATDATSWLNQVDSTLQSSVRALTSARTLVVASGNGAYGQDQKDSIATELEGIRDDLLAQANTSLNGRTVFAGSSDAGKAFAVGTDTVTGKPTYTFTGAVGGTTMPVQRRVADSVTVQVDGDGAAAYGDGTDSVFAALDRAAAALRGGTADTSAILGELDGHLTALKAANSLTGSRQKQVLNAQSALADRVLNNSAQLSSVQDIDLASVTLDLQAQELAYKGALAATAKTLQPSLLEFLS